jgi:serine/threonine protein kinase
VLRPHVVGDEEARARLEREVSTLERVRSPWVAEIVDADPWGPVPYVATRYVDGPSLHDQVTHSGRSGAARSATSRAASRRRSSPCTRRACCTAT